jgi:diadenosine tetraphosphate (Ap4A) HIT family hydrolase
MLRLGSVAVPDSAVTLRTDRGGALSVACEAAGANACVAGHHVVVPTRSAVARLSDLTRDELDEFATAVVATMTTLRSASSEEPVEPPPTAFNISIKDGASAGAPFETLHAHVCPRRPGDLKPDEIFERIDSWSPRVGETNHQPKADWPDDADRKNRTPDAMFAEAAGYAAYAAKHGLAGGCLPEGRVPFGKFTLSPKQVFYVSPTGSSMASVNLKPLLPGHVLVITARATATMCELPADELVDVWETVRVVQVSHL